MDNYFRKQVSTFTHDELRTALVENKHLYTETQRQILQEEWKKRLLHRPTLAITHSVPTTNLYVKDTQHIETVFNAISVLLKILAALFITISIYLFCSSFDLSEGIEKLIVNKQKLIFSLFLFVITILLTRWALLRHSIIYGYYYDVRRMRMMIEEDMSNV